MVCFRCLNGGKTIASFIAAIWGLGLEEVSDGTAHGGTVIHDQDSRSANNHRLQVTKRPRLVNLAAFCSKLCTLGQLEGILFQLHALVVALDQPRDVFECLTLLLAVHITPDCRGRRIWLQSQPSSAPASRVSRRPLKPSLVV